MRAIKSLRRPWAFLAALAAIAMIAAGAGQSTARAEQSAEVQRGLKLLQDESAARAAIVKQVSPAVVNMVVMPFRCQPPSRFLPSRPNQCTFGDV